MATMDDLDIDRRAYYDIDVLTRRNDAAGLPKYFAETFPQLPAATRAEYASLEALGSSTSPIAQLMHVATNCEAPDTFEVLFRELFAPHTAAEVASAVSPDARAALDANEWGMISWACLRQAAQWGSIPMARAFIRCEPASVRRRLRAHPVHGTQQTPHMAFAMVYGKLDYIDFLCSTGEASINQDWPCSLLRYTCELQQDTEDLTARVQWLLSRGIRVRGASALWTLAGFGEHGLSAARALLEHGADVEDEVSEDGGPDARRGRTPGDSPLMAAVRIMDLSMVELLLDWGADIHLANSRGETPLSLAKVSGDFEIVSLLLGGTEGTYEFGR